MLLNIYFALAGLGIVIRRSKLLTSLLLAFAWVLTWNTTTADHANYESIYRSLDFRDYGYSLLCNIFNILNVDFLTFKLIISAIIYVIIYKFINKYAYYNCLVAALYLLFLSQLDIVQFRNFIAFGIYLLAIPYLLKETSVSKMIYCGIVLLATTVHASMLFYLCFVFVNKKVLTSAKNIILGSIASLFLFAITFFIGFDLEDRIDQYSQATSSLTKYVMVGMFVLNLIYIYIYKRRIRNYDQSVALEKLSDTQYAYTVNPADIVLFMNIAIFLILPLALNSLNYIRLFRFLSLFNFIYVLNIYRLKPYIYDWILVIIYGATFLVLVFFMHMMSFTYGIMEPIFYENLLLSSE